MLRRGPHRRDLASGSCYLVRISATGGQASGRSRVIWYGVPGILRSQMPHGVTNSDLTAMPLDSSQRATGRAMSDSLANTGSPSSLACSGYPIPRRGPTTFTRRGTART